jgi:hypothetical protein
MSRPTDSDATHRRERGDDLFVAEFVEVFQVDAPDSWASARQIA